MKQFTIGHVTVTFSGFDDSIINDDMAKEALKYAECHKEIPLAVINAITITCKDSNKSVFDVKYRDEDQPKIGRIRRITGYLTGTIDRWNNAKRAELRDRVCHCG